MNEELLAEAEKVLRLNDRGEYTIPSVGIYPHQWNWDSAFIALGWAHIDPKRCRQEFTSLAGGANHSGMIPHIMFSRAGRASYMPKSDLWGTNLYGADGRRVSGITQPPVAAICLRSIWPFCQDQDKEWIVPVIRALARWHSFLAGVRAQGSGGEPVIVHPWETGRDNAVEWDSPLMRVIPSRTMPSRVDTHFVPSEQRPVSEHYSRYISLCETYKEWGWDQRRLAREAPFRVLDPSFSAILSRSAYELAKLAHDIDENQVEEQSWDVYDTVTSALVKRRDSDGCIWPIDLVADSEIHRRSCALGIQLLCPKKDDKWRDTIVPAIVTGDLSSPFGVCSTGRGDPDFSNIAYWRGPVWANVTWLIAYALSEHQYDDAAKNMFQRCLTMVREAGYREYAHPDTGGGLGAHDFSWSAAVAYHVLEGRFSA